MVLNSPFLYILEKSSALMPTVRVEAGTPAAFPVEEAPDPSQPPAPFPEVAVLGPGTGSVMAFLRGHLSKLNLWSRLGRALIWDSWRGLSRGPAHLPSGRCLLTKAIYPHKTVQCGMASSIYLIIIF